MTRRERPMIAWYGDMLFLPHLLGIIRSGGVACDVHFGEPIRVADFSDRKALARATEAAVRNLAEAAWRAEGATKRSKITAPISVASRSWEGRRPIDG